MHHENIATHSGIYWAANVRGFCFVLHERIDMSAAASNRIIELSASICAKQSQAAQLGLELVSSLAIQALWPEAWDNGCTVTLCALENVRTMERARLDVKRGKTPTLKSTFLRRSDGVEFPISSADYWRIKQLPRGKS